MKGGFKQKTNSKALLRHAWQARSPCAFAMQTANVSKMFRNLVFPLTELGANRPKRTASSRKKQLFTQFNVVIGNA